MKQKSFLAIAIVLFCGASQTFAAGFDRGNNFLATPIQGQIQIQCQGNIPAVQEFRCTDEILDPSEFAAFVSANKVDADEVLLVAKHTDNSSSKESEDFDHEKGRSNDFNLWISTLLQHPLLDYGVNEIAYTLKKNGTAVENGTFKAIVQKAPKKVCANNDFYVSNNPQDCRDGGTFCDQYFRQENYCK